MSPLTSANLALRFLLELCALAAVAYWGSQATTSTIANVALAIAAPLAVAAFWGALLAPSSTRRPDPPLRTIAELLVLALAVAALLAAGSTVLAIVLAIAAVLNGLLLHALDADAQLPSQRQG